MILYGRMLSPFVRRIGIWLNLQGRAFEHNPIGTLGADFGALKQVNPMGRVPALKLDDGTVLVESWAMQDYLEETAPADRRLLPTSGPARLRALQGVSLAHAMSEKAVALAGEVFRRPPELQVADLKERLEGQIRTTLDILEAHTPESGFAGGGGPTGVTAATVASFDFVAKVYPKLVGDAYPRCTAMSQRANALPAFASTFPT